MNHISTTKPLLKSSKCVGVGGDAGGGADAGDTGAAGGNEFPVARVNLERLSSCSTATALGEGEVNEDRFANAATKPNRLNGFVLPRVAIPGLLRWLLGRLRRLGVH
jgi:hypothetical protein